VLGDACAITKGGFMEYKELVERVAEDVKPLMIYLDMFLMKYNIEDINRIIENMEDGNSTLAAWPFPETMRKAEIMISQTETFIKFRDLLKTRISQMEIQRKPDSTPGKDLLRAMGLQ
jgi:hypothetical protein